MFLSGYLAYHFGWPCIFYVFGEFWFVVVIHKWQIQSTHSYEGMCVLDCPYYFRKFLSHQTVIRNSTATFADIC